MDKSKENINTLIKRKSLKNLLKSYNLRAGEEVIKEIEKELLAHVKSKLSSAKENMIINARRTLKKEDF
ncbi:MAG: hypothetical protein Q8L27_03985 [archaeon]|nr:hypothetical protein [archaeon]